MRMIIGNVFQDIWENTLKSTRTHVSQLSALLTSESRYLCRGILKNKQYTSYDKFKHNSCLKSELFWVRKLVTNRDFTAVRCAVLQPPLWW